MGVFYEAPSTLEPKDVTAILGTGSLCKANGQRLARPQHEGLTSLFLPCPILIATRDIVFLDRFSRIAIE